MARRTASTSPLHRTVNPPTRSFRKNTLGCWPSRAERWRRSGATPTIRFGRLSPAVLVTICPTASRGVGKPSWRAAAALITTRSSSPNLSSEGENRRPAAGLTR